MTPESAASFTAALVAGITYGTAYCGPSCGPFLCTYIMGTDTGSVQAARSMAVFTVARIATYGIVGAASALLGMSVFSSQVGNSFVPGLVVIVIGTLMWRRAPKHEKSEKPIRIGEPIPSCSGGCLRSPSTMPLWLAGVAFALAPCPPMLAMLACSANAGSPLSGAVVMMLFGLGTSLTPLVVMGLLAGTFSQKIRRLAPQQDLLFRRTASAALMLLGTAMLFAPA